MGKRFAGVDLSKKNEANVIGDVRVEEFVFFIAKNGHPIAHTLTDAFSAFVAGFRAVVVAEMDRFLLLRFFFDHVLASRCPGSSLTVEETVRVLRERIAGDSCEYRKFAPKQETRFDSRLTGLRSN